MNAPRKTIAATVSISPVSDRDASGGTVNLRLALIVDDEPQNLNQMKVTAIARACERMYGRGCWWWADSGLRGYGQVMRASAYGNGSAAVTCRARIDVEIDSLPDTHNALLREHENKIAYSMEVQRKKDGADFSEGENDALNGRHKKPYGSYHYNMGYSSGRWQLIDESDD